MKMDGREFGSCMHVSAFALIGDIDEHKCFLIDKEIIDSIGMHLTGLSPTVWKFPTADGKGGEGATIVESLTESFVGWDYWSKLGGTYFFLVSCKKYDIDTVKSILEKYFKIVDSKWFTLELTSGVNT